MRLGLRKALKPFHSLTELADHLRVTVPALKRRLAEFTEQGEEIDLEVLLAEGKATYPTQEEDHRLFQLFFSHTHCLVCGNPVRRIEDRQAGWGEFFQCDVCEFSAHENAEFTEISRFAAKRLRELREQMFQAKALLKERQKNARELVFRQS